MPDRPRIAAVGGCSGALTRLSAKQVWVARLGAFPGNIGASASFSALAAPGKTDKNGASLS